MRAYYDQKVLTFVGDSKTIECGDWASVGIEVSGTFVGSLSFTAQTSGQSSGGPGVSVYNSSGTAVSTITALGRFIFPAAGANTLCIKLDALSSGSPTVTLTQSAANFVPPAVASGGVAGDASASNQTNGTQLTRITNGTQTADTLLSETGQNAVLVAGNRKEVPFSTGSVQAVASTDAGNYRWVSVHVITQGTSSTVTFQTSNDNINWVTCILGVVGANATSGVGSTTAANTMFAGSIQGRYFRLNVTGISALTTAGVVEFFATAGALATMGVLAFENGNFTTQGVTASGVTAAGNPLRIGGIFVTTQPTVTTGQSVDIQATNRGAVIVASGIDPIVVQPGNTANTTPWLVTSTSLPLPTGAATSAKQAAPGVAGTPSADVLTVQGTASMTPLKIDGSAITQPISGTVTANAGTNLNTSALALDTSVNGILVSTASTTAGQKGTLVQAASTAAAPTYVEGKTNPLSADLAGNLRVTGSLSIAANSSVNVNQVAGTAVDTNSGNKSAGTQRFVLATDQPNLTTPFNVALTSTPLPTGASTNAGITGTSSKTLTDIFTVLGTPLQAGGSVVVTSAPTTAVTNAGLTNIDVALSTRLKPADTLAGITTVGAVTAITNALPAGTNLIGKTGIDQTTPGTTNRVSIGTDGTVIANAGTNLNTSALALDTSINGILLSQASTTSGQKGALIQGAVSTAAPTYTNAQTSPLSIDTVGNLRVTNTPSGTQTISGSVTANAGTNLNTSLLARETGGNLDAVNNATTSMAVQLTTVTTHLASISTNTDVALSTRLKPADTLTGVTTVGAVTAITNALPVGTNVLGKIGIDQTTPGTTNNVSVTTKSVAISQTLTVTASSAYTSGNEVGGLSTFAGAVGTAGSGIVQSIRATSKSVQTGPLKLYLFNVNPTNTTWTDKTTPAINAADVSSVIGVYSLSSTDSGLGTHTIYTLDGVGKAFSIASGTSLYGVLVTTGTPTFGSSSDIVVTINVLQD